MTIYGRKFAGIDRHPPTGIGQPSEIPQLRDALVNQAERLRADKSPQNQEEL